MASRAFLFDLDGTLWRGHEWYASVLADLTDLRRASILEGLASGGNIFRLSEQAGISKDRLVRSCHDGIDRLALYAGVRPSLEKFAGEGHKLGIVTSLPKRLADPPLAMLELDQYFEAKIFAARKPSPGPLLGALAKLNEEVDEHHFYVGDTAGDAECASRAGISFAWASYGYGKIAMVNPHRVLREFSDILKLLDLEERSSPTLGG